MLQRHFLAAIKAQEEGNADQLAMHSSGEGMPSCAGFLCRV